MEGAQQERDLLWEGHRGVTVDGFAEETQFFLGEGGSGEGEGLVFPLETGGELF